MDLFLFTSFFPFKKSEPFLVNEFVFTKKHFKSISILSLYGKLEDSKITPGKDLQILQPILDSPENKKQIFVKGFFNLRGARHHLLDFFRQKLFLSARKTYWFFTSLLITRLTLSSRSYKDLIDRVNQSHDPVLYFYWGDNLCWIVPYLQKKISNKKIKIVIRFHRTDLYENLKGGYAPLREQIFELADLLVPISQDGENYLSQRYPAFKNKLFLSRLGVFDFGANELNKSSVKQIISVSGITAVKRVHLIFETLQKTKNNIVWHHFGDGPLSDNLKTIVKLKRQNLEIVLHGFVDNKTLMTFYKEQGIDLLINVSSSEGLPVSIMEALSFGIPVIATDVGGTNELVNPDNGCLVEANFGTSELAVTIDKILDLPLPALELLRRNARLTYQEKVSAEKNYELFYKKIEEL